MFRKLLLVSGFVVTGFILPVQGIEMGLDTGIHKSVKTTSGAALFEQRMQDLYRKIDHAPSGLNYTVFKKAMVGYLNLKRSGELAERPLLTVVDFEKPSHQKRLWVIDLASEKIIYNTLVAHGRNSGLDIARNFSNTSESYMSSLGFYVTDQTYSGKHGLSLKLRGMDENFNTNAMARSVVMHGADYVSESFIKTHGRLGRSHGCPALPMDVHQDIIGLIKDRTCLYLHHPSKEYNSKYLDRKMALSAFLRHGLTI